MQGKPRLRGCRERIAVLAAGLSAYSMAGTLARMAQASHAPSQPSHARPKSLPLARGDAAKAGRDEEQALAFSRTKNTVGLCCGPEFPRSPKKSLRRSARLENLGHIDLLVREGFYSNRTDFIRTAIRNQLDRHADAVRQSVARRTLDLGLRHYSRADLEAARERGEALCINVLGLASIASDVTPELARVAIASVTIVGALHASPAVRAALADRIR